MRRSWREACNRPAVNPLVPERTGQILGMTDFRAISGDAECVTIDENGVIYVTDRTPNIYVLEPGVAVVPVPAAWALMASGLLLLGMMRRRRS